MEAGLYQRSSGLDAASYALRKAALRAERDHGRFRRFPVPLLDRSLQRPQRLGVELHGGETLARPPYPGLALSGERAPRCGEPATVRGRSQTRSDLPLLQADHHPAVALERREELDLLDGRQRRATGLEVEGGAVMHAPDLAWQHLTVAQGVALMSALVGQGVELTLLLDEDDLRARHDKGLDAVLGVSVNRPAIEHALPRLRDLDGLRGGGGEHVRVGVCRHASGSMMRP